MTSPVPTNPAALSPSKRSDACCPYRYQQIHVLGRSEPYVPMPLLVGRLVHQLAEHYFEHLASTGQATDYEALDQAARSVWRRRPSEIPESEYGDFEQFTDTLRDFSVPPGYSVEAVESRLAFDDRGQPATWDDCAYGGMLDLTMLKGRHLLIVDWTTAALGGVFEAKKDEQLRFYGMLAWMKWKKPEITVETRSLRTGARRFVELEHGDHEAMWARLTRERERLLDALDDEYVASGSDWPAQPGHVCGICRLRCPLGESWESVHGSPVRIETQDQARKLHERLILLERQRSHIMKALKRYVGVHGLLDTNGVVARIQVQKRREYDTQEVYRRLLEADYNEREILGILRVDRRKLNRVVADRDLFMAIEDTAKVKDVETFKPVDSARKETEDAD